MVIAGGGIAGNLELVREYWPLGVGRGTPTPAQRVDPEADGRLIFAAKQAGARVTHLEKMWITRLEWNTGGRRTNFTV